eukprot:SAG11_NODE_1336_length_5173_cov_10.716791_5_plen_71_part_00
MLSRGRTTVRLTSTGEHKCLFSRFGALMGRRCFHLILCVFIHRLENLEGGTLTDIEQATNLEAAIQKNLE